MSKTCCRSMVPMVPYQRDWLFVDDHAEALVKVLFTMAQPGGYVLPSGRASRGSNLRCGECDLRALSMQSWYRSKAGAREPVDHLCHVTGRGMTTAMRSILGHGG